MILVVDRMHSQPVMFIKNNILIQDKPLTKITENKLLRNLSCVK